LVLTKKAPQQRFESADQNPNGLLRKIYHFGWTELLHCALLGIYLEQPTFGLYSGTLNPTGALHASRLD